MKHRIFKIICFFTIIIVCLYLYARYINIAEFKVNEIAITDKNLDKDYNGLKIAHFSDLHYGRTTNEDTLKKLVKEINHLNADLIIFTGDLFDNQNITTEEEELITKYFKKINTKLFKFAILGDYDQKNRNTYSSILEKSDFILLENESKLVYYESQIPINIIGLTNTDEIAELYDNEYFNITLVHEPDNIKNIPNTNIVFAGHSMGGQIKIPFIGGIRKIEGASTYIDSFYQVKDTKLYISNGIGTQDFSLRLFNAPSITLYRLYQK